MSAITTTIRIDSDLKKQADELFEDFGMTFSGAVNAFVKQAVREQSIPFRLTREVPNATTIAAMLEAERILSDPNAKSFSSVEELFEDLDA